MRKVSFRRSFTVSVAAVAVIVFAALRCGHGAAGPAVDLGATAPTATTATGSICLANGAMPTLDCAALPNTSAIGQWTDSAGTALSPQPSSGQTTPNAYLDYDLWAWNSFVAMNWPAIVPSAANNYSRGMPDQTKSFAGASSTDLTVWETYKEKREVFLYDYVSNKPSTETPQPWNSAPQYGPSNAQVPCCPGSTCGAGREIGSGSKLFFDTFDETAEVASEARETQAALCAGWLADPASQCAANPSVNPCCTLTGTGVGPRVWRGPFGQGLLLQGVPQPPLVPRTPVVYEVKLNYDSFQYIIGSSLYNVSNARTAATNGQIRLPARTSDASMPASAGSSGQGAVGSNPGTWNYSAQTCLGATGAPCSAGAVHLKAAWLQLVPGFDDFSKFHTTRGLSYHSTSSVPGGICKADATFGLIGLHIIQRIHQSDNTGTGPNSTTMNTGTTKGRPQGGTYIFATWEHVANDQGFNYANYPTSGSQVPYPNVKTAPALPLNRVYPPLASTTRATALVRSMLGCTPGGAPTDSVWCNYRLIGTQYVATQTPSPQPTLLDTLTPQSANIEAPANSGQPYYLANLVVESNAGLQQFQGLPPSGDPSVITVIQQFATHNFSGTFPKPAQGFNHTADNLAWRTQKGPNNQFVMGGCMGCHGVAQLSGYSFSFVLLDNQYGAIPDSQHSFAIPPTPGQPTSTSN
jgi:hypothetical protein